MTDESDTVTFKLVGGLGNQLFIWATSIAYANRTGKRILLDAAECTQWGEQLNNFNIKVDVPGPDIPDGILPTLFLNENNYALNLLRDLRYKKRMLGLGNTFWEDSRVSFDSRLFHSSDYKTVRGYFQSYKYFEEFSSEIRKQLTSKKEFSANYKKILGQVPEKFTAINLRLGKDYIGKGSIFGLVGKEYVSKSLAIIDSEYPDQAKVVFTDNLKLAKEIISDADMYLDHEDLNNPAEKMLLMSKSNSLIGSNSSFSWWSAYLMAGEELIRIFPKPWFHDPKVDTSNLLPKEWMQIQNLN
jgi:hypothetical protein